MIRSPRRPLLQIQWRVFLNEQNTEARRPVLLVEMIPKVESEVFAQWGNATKDFSHRKVILVSHGRREEEYCLEEHSFSCQKLCEGDWQEALVLPPARPGP